MMKFSKESQIIFDCDCSILQNYTIDHAGTTDVPNSNAADINGI